MHVSLLFPSSVDVSDTPAYSWVSVTSLFYCVSRHYIITVRPDAVPLFRMTAWTSCENESIIYPQCSSYRSLRGNLAREVIAQCHSIEKRTSGNKMNTTAYRAPLLKPHVRADHWAKPNRLCPRGFLGNPSQIKTIKCAFSFASCVSTSPAVPTFLVTSCICMF